jgi:hypothetical protein
MISSIIWTNRWGCRFFPVCSAQSFSLDGGTGPFSFHLRLHARDSHGDRLKGPLWIRGFLQIAPAEVEGAIGVFYLFRYGFFYYHFIKFCSGFSDCSANLHKI